ncbi:RT06-like protein [Mya arenaria]|uniref:Small ribosomal subunit protein bS6m n=1 Tax=Mya arenaria TaxID=6604 RepID=A0ABY7ED17_MYAAR|nr:RT06-like protein [Mya arenaria]
MPPYEMALVLRNAANMKLLKESLKGACKQIWEQGGLIKKVENLGKRELPHPTNYFCIQFDNSVDGMRQVEHKLRNADEVVKFGIIGRREENQRPCQIGQCLFGELPHPEHERHAYKKRVLKKFKAKLV